ncbi:MAG: 30S ribosomal protein S7 [Patescibacteria group bacterium]
MPRVKKVIHRLIKADPLLNNRQIAKLINKIMIDGKKSVAQKHVYATLEQIKVKTKLDPLTVLRQALDNIKPNMEVRSRRVGGAAYQVPMPVRGDRRDSLGVRWLIAAAKSRPNREFHHFSEKLTAEILDAANNQGGAVDKKNQIHKMAEANKAFSHFHW